MLNTPFRLVFMSLSQYSSVMFSVGILVGFIPAQLKTWSIRSHSEMIAETNSLQDEVLLTSNADV